MFVLTSKFGSRYAELAGDSLLDLAGELSSVLAVHLDHPGHAGHLVVQPRHCEQTEGVSKPGIVQGVWPQAERRFQSDRDRDDGHTAGEKFRLETEQPATVADCSFRRDVEGRSMW